MGEESDSDAVEEVRSGLIVEGAVEHDMGGVIEHLVAVAAAGRLKRGDTTAGHCVPSLPGVCCE